MSQQADIEYIEHTWNPIVMRCTKVSDGCKNCWHLRMADRHEGNEKLPPKMRAARGGTGPFYLHEAELTAPLRRKKPTRYAVQFMGDLFHADVRDEWIDRVFAVMALCPQHTFLVLTKRAKQMSRYLSSMFRAKAIDDAKCEQMATMRDRGSKVDAFIGEEGSGYFEDGHIRNVWLGVSVENQQAADERIPHLLKCPAAVRWISAEPLLGPVDLTRLAFGAHRMIDCLVGDVMTRPEDESADPEVYAAAPGAVGWVVAGGEAGPGARPMHPKWARSLRDQCQAADVPFFFKQWGDWYPAFADAGAPGGTCKKSLQVGDQQFWCVGKKAAGRLLNGREWNEMPNIAGV